MFAVIWGGIFPLWQMWIFVVAVRGGEILMKITLCI